VTLPHAKYIFLNRNHLGTIKGGTLHIEGVGVQYSRFCLVVCVSLSVYTKIKLLHYYAAGRGRVGPGDRGFLGLGLAIGLSFSAW